MESIDSVPVALSAPAEGNTSQGTKSSLDGTGERSPRKRSSNKRSQTLPEPHRALPQSLEAEKGVLCSALLSPQTVIGDCVERIDEKHFYHPAHQTIYQVLVDFWKDNKPIDSVTIIQTLRDRGLLESVGGPAAISELVTFLPTPSNANYYLEVLKEKALLRQIILTCTEFAARSYDEQHDVKSLLDEVEGRILEIGDERHKATFPEMRDQVMKAISDIETLYRTRGGVTGMSTGFKKLDQMTGGLRGSEMIVIAARPSMGKTAFAMNIAEHVALTENRPVGVFSLEMSSQQLVQRLLCSHARVNLRSIRDGFLSSQDSARITRSAAALSKCKMYIDDTSGLSILELRAKARRMKDRFGIELIVIDYLQLMRSTTKRAMDNRQIEIAEISSGVKALAKELNIPAIVLAQLNRKPDERGGRPRLSDLRESGSIEQDADLVGLLVRPEYYGDNEEEKQEKGGEAELIIAKQRNGPVGDVPLTFLKEFTRFEDRAETREEKA